MGDVLTFEIAGIKDEVVDVKTFWLHLIENQGKLVYKAGQFLTFIFQHHEQEIRRSYSLSSSPDVDENLSITIKRELNGVIGRWLFANAKVGDLLTAMPPSGMFTIKAQTKKARDIFLIAAGSGITPIFSILKSILIQEPQSRITLIYSNHDEASTIFLQPLRALQQQFSHQLHIEFLFSNHQHILKARLSATSLEMLLKKHLRHAKSDALVYTCGPYGFMQMVQIIALTNGFNKEHIRKEIFATGNELLPAKQYFDHTDRAVTIINHQVEHHIKVPYNKSILDAALHNDIAIPFSCKAGRCSSCKAKLVSGKVWMHYNEVLTDEDEKAGWILTCTAHPETENVVVDLD